MVGMLVTAEIVLELPLAATLAFCLLLRLRTKRWWNMPSWLIIAVALLAVAGYLLTYYGSATGQLSLSESTTAQELFIPAIAGVGLLIFAASRGAQPVGPPAR